MASNQPAWYKPTPSNPSPVLKIYNSLTKRKDEFIPLYGNIVKWYNCGPTVYDASHMGHARNYVTQDILRRIMEDYFGYDVHLVMNVTDIDDKIIIRARHEHLVENLRKENTSLSPKLLEFAAESWDFYFVKKIQKIVSEEEPNAQYPDSASQWKYVVTQSANQTWLAKLLAKEEKFSMHITTLENAEKAIEVAKKRVSEGNTTQEDVDLLISGTRDVFALRLDESLKHTVEDPAIFRSLAAYWEDSFMADMARLRVKPPSTLTRVTDYVQEIVEYVEKIISNGYAYDGKDGNVWFDKTAFDGAQKKGDGWAHEYAKLAPWSRGNQALLAEGEGALTNFSSKRSREDFALWKASKPGEPSWSSPWGQGRPGWHIECSVMASDILGEQMDIHSGGIDLLFPHHDNELAQSEAYYDNAQWVNYFMHTGHLHIAGLKMSKSLKNFITIHELLQTNTPRQVRLSFLTQLWNNRMDIGESLHAEVKGREAVFDNFFVQVKALVSEWDAHPTPENGTWKHGKDEKDLTKELHQQQHAFRSALCDSFNTPQALQILQDLVSTTNVYLKRGRSATNIGVVRQVASWITKMLRVFGLGEGPPSEIGWGTAEDGSATADKEVVLMPYLRTLSTFRDEVRRKAMAKVSHQEFLDLTDRLRDEELVNLGVALDDQEDGKALVKLVPSEQLQRVRDEKRALVAEKARKKAEAKEGEAAKQLAKLEKGKLAPESIFKPPVTPDGTFGSWDEKGIPLTDAQGEEISKAKKKKLVKEWEEQNKRHEAWKAYIANQGASSGGPSS